MRAAFVGQGFLNPMDGAERKAASIWPQCLLDECVSKTAVLLTKPKPETLLQSATCLVHKINEVEALTKQVKVARVRGFDVNESVAIFLFEDQSDLG
ncbi:MAG: hypothetical protein WD872_09200 [Pirellulaceae bacterium]